ncbi:MAG: Gfo/Idh/MocA family protein [Thermoguttaceae bacterium]|jgi:predicted dehydrogenase
MKKQFSRRDFLKSSALSATAASVLMSAGRVHAAENNTLKVGLIGCGGRGRGALVNTLEADPNTELVAVGDAFRENAEGAIEGFVEEFGDRINVTPDRIFDGLDCFKQVIPECDVVLLCETPGFRPRSLRLAVESGKHVFCEKPVAVDAPGIRSVFESTEIAKKNGTTLVSGLCWRYHPKVREMVQRVKDGEIGDVISGRLLYLVGQLWTRPRRKGDTEMKYQVRDWYNFCWLSGDFNIEQQVHTLDKALWVMDNVAPDHYFGIGARMQRIQQPANGDIYDAMASCLEYDNGVSFYSYCRQQNNCWSKNDAIIAGTKGTAHLLSGLILDYKGNVVYRYDDSAYADMYLIEHQEMYKSIRGGATINNGDIMAKATMMGIATRMACYTGRRLSYDEALNDNETMDPTGYTWDDSPWNLPDAEGRYLIPVPGEGRQIHHIVRG